MSSAPKTTLKSEDFLARIPENNVDVYRMNTDYIPFLMPIFRTFFDKNERTCMAMNVHMDDEWQRVFLSNCCRHPCSYFVVDDNKEPVAFFFFDATFRNPNDDPKARLPYPKLTKEDPIHTLEAMMDYYEHKVFEMKPELNKMMIGETLFVDEKYRGSRLGGRLTVLASKDLAKQTMPLGFTGYCALLTSDANRGNFKKLKMEEFGELPDSLYVKPDGTHFRLAENNQKALICFVSFEEVLKMPPYK